MFGSVVVEVKGNCEEDFLLVQEAFEANFDSGEELGASAAVTVDGQPVVDLWAGSKNLAGEPWQENTIVNVYSTTKTMASICMLMLADRNLIEFSDPVAKYWPEFAANGKDEVLVSHVMTHQTGCSGFPRIISARELYDHELCASLLAEM